MKKYLSFIAIALGIFVNLIFFSSEFNAFIVSVMPVFVIEVIGVILAILTSTKYKEDNNKILGIIGLVLNLIPVITYFPNFLLT